jgi:hypothetical protein
LARKRMIKPDYPINPKVCRCRIEARYLNICMWPFADDRGYFPDNVRYMAGNVFLNDDNVTEKQVLEWRDQLVEANLWIPLEFKGRKLIYLKNWDEHQFINRPSDNGVVSKSDIKALNQYKNKVLKDKYGDSCTDSVSDSCTDSVSDSRLNRIEVNRIEVNTSLIEKIPKDPDRPPIVHLYCLVFDIDLDANTKNSIKPENAIALHDADCKSRADLEWAEKCMKGWKQNGYGPHNLSWLKWYRAGEFELAGKIVKRNLPPTKKKKTKEELAYHEKMMRRARLEKEREEKEIAECQN